MAKLFCFNIKIDAKKKERKRSCKTRDPLMGISHFHPKPDDLQRN